MSAIQVKNVPADLHEELRRRAAAEGKTVGEVVLAAIRKDLQRQSMREWLDRVAEHRPDPPVTRAQLNEALRESRSEIFGEDDT